MQYRVPTNDQPTYLNKDAAVGALIGSLFTPILGTAAGAMIGGYIGEKRMEKELAQGKIVKEPSFWNQDTAIGGLLGHLGGVLAGAAAAMIIGSGGIALMAVGAIAGTAYGIMQGGQHGKARMEREYTEAAMQQGGFSRAPSPSLQVESAGPSKSFAGTLEAERQKAVSYAKSI